MNDVLARRSANIYSKWFDRVSYSVVKIRVGTQGGTLGIREKIKIILLLLPAPNYTHKRCTHKYNIIRMNYELLYSVIGRTYKYLCVVSIRPTERERVIERVEETRLCRTRPLYKQPTTTTTIPALAHVGPVKHTHTHAQ